LHVTLGSVHTIFKEKLAMVLFGFQAYATLKIILLIMCQSSACKTENTKSKNRAGVGTYLREYKRILTYPVN
jgi:hypothetical protein